MQFGNFGTRTVERDGWRSQIKQSCIGLMEIACNMQRLRNQVDFKVSLHDGRSAYISLVLPVVVMPEGTNHEGDGGAYLSKIPGYADTPRRKAQ